MTTTTELQPLFIEDFEIYEILKDFGKRRNNKSVSGYTLSCVYHMTLNRRLSMAPRVQDFTDCAYIWKSMTEHQKKVWNSYAKHLNAGGTLFGDVWRACKKTFAEMCLALAPAISAKW